MNVRAVFHLISFLLIMISLAVLSCWGVSLYYDDPVSAQHGLLYSAIIIFVVGLTTALLTRGHNELSRRDGFGIVTFGWLIAAILGALPYLLSGAIPHPVTAIFETMSGFTTTGASALSDPESLPRGILFWRSMTQWFGGMGVLVLCVAILPFLGVGGMQIYRAEMPGPSKDRLTPRITSTAKLLWGVYLMLTVAQTLLLMACKVDWFDALCHSFTTVSTGGFSTHNASVAYYDNVWVEIIIIVFMFLAGINFAMHFRALRGQVNVYWKDPEFRFYIGMITGGILFMTFNTWRSVYPSFGEALRGASFQTVSILTTTGFGTKDYNLWPDTSRVLLVIFMIMGGCAGSTAGGMKLVRVFVVWKKTIREIRLFMQPKAVVQVKLGKKPLDPTIISNISAFFIIFTMIIVTATLLMTFYTPDFETAGSAVIATLANIGPGLNAVGPMQNYGDIPAMGKVILIICMLLGRLELYTVLALFLPRFWKP